MLKMEIIPAQSADHLLAARKLFMEYADCLGTRNFQMFEWARELLVGEIAT